VSDLRVYVQYPRLGQLPPPQPISRGQKGPPCIQNELGDPVEPMLENVYECVEAEIIDNGRRTIPAQGESLVDPVKDGLLPLPPPSSGPTLTVEFEVAGHTASTVPCAFGMPAPCP
jgi:hypothetical protein